MNNILSDVEAKKALDRITISLKICSICRSYHIEHRECVRHDCKSFDKLDIEDSRLPEDVDGFLTNLASDIQMVLGE